MGIKDIATTKYMQQNEIFADAFNYFVYGGENVIDPDSLIELDTKEIGLPYGGSKDVKQPVQKTRDVIKSVTAMTDRRTAYMVLAIENQSDVHYAMPVKNLVYDALQYAKQVETAAASHRKSGDYKDALSGEFLSGFTREDHLMPVVTLVVYFGKKPWDGPMSIHEMFADQDAKILSVVPDYKINLIAPAELEDQDFNKFGTTLKEVLCYIKYSDDADKLKELIESDENFQRLGRREVDVLNNCANANLSMEEKEETVNVNKALQVLQQRAADKAAEETTKNNIKNLMESLGLTVAQAMDALKISDADREKLFLLLDTTV